MEKEAQELPLETAKARTRTGQSHGRWLVAGSLLASLATGRLAFAQEKSAPAGEAARLYADGVKAARAGQWEVARAALLAAFERKPDAKRAANLGLVELMSGKPRDAAEHLSFFLREGQDVNDHDRQATEEMLAKAKASIGTVTIQVDTRGAEVLVDGRRVGTSPLADPVFMESGRRSIEVKKTGLTSLREEIDVAAGSAPVVTLKLPPVLKPTVDPMHMPGLDKGAPPETGAPRWRTWGVVSSAGVAAVGAGVGIGFSFAANAKNAAALEERDTLANHTLVGHSICTHQAGVPRCGRLPDLVEARDTYRNVAITSFAVAGVGAAGALFSALWSPSRQGRITRKEGALSVVPSIQGVVVTGSF